VTKPRKISIAITLVLVALAAAFLMPWGTGGRSRADYTNPELVAQGKEIYQQYCASCHGRELEGQPDWRTRGPSGALPAPPHDESGHTWHHPDQLLFEMTKYGVKPFAPADWVSDMPAFNGVLSDEQIWAVLAYIKSRWPERMREYQQQRNAAAK
jgi:mono/diheme cytochrome c family protein